MTILAEHAPGLAPAPLEAALDTDPPTISMSRLPGRVLRGERVNDEHLTAMAATLHHLHQIPTQVVEAVKPAPWGPAVAMDKVRTLADKQPDLGDSTLAQQAYREAVAWLASTEPDQLTTNPYAPVLGLADGNHANYLWDDQTRRVRTEPGGAQGMVQHREAEDERQRPGRQP